MAYVIFNAPLIGSGDCHTGSPTHISVAVRTIVSLCISDHPKSALGPQRVGGVL